MEGGLFLSSLLSLISLSLSHFLPSFAVDKMEALHKQTSLLLNTSPASAASTLTSTSLTPTLLVAAVAAAAAAPAAK